MQSAAISIQNVSKTYATGLTALKAVNLEIAPGEIFALLGPNGAGKTTLISIICGTVTKSSGTVLVSGHDNASDFRNARSLIGLVPQELHLSIFETVWDTVAFSRMLFGKPRNDAYLEKVLRQLSLWDKRDSKIMALSGGMKRRVLIAKALAHEPRILFLDEPTAGVDVELRQDMWRIVRDLRESGVTIILTTHYIEEAEDLADRVGVISKGELILVEEKKALMRKMGQKQLTLELTAPLAKLPKALAALGVTLAKEGRELVYAYDMQKPRHTIAEVLQAVTDAKVKFGDLHTEQSSLEDIFMGLVKQ
ncbi:ABC transporter ATP-binding protein [Aestuariivirga sp.]|uniref:ABC transporter ATP-binding protein n=1 Tax=Aestuariivirga sp. TaxID=2650926 RepID=UPI0039E64B68